MEGFRPSFRTLVASTDSNGRLTAPEARKCLLKEKHSWIQALECRMFNLHSSEASARGFDTAGADHEERATRCIRCGDCITGRQEAVPRLATPQSQGPSRSGWHTISASQSLAFIKDGLLGSRRSMTSSIVSCLCRVSPVLVLQHKGKSCHGFALQQSKNTMPCA